MALLRLAQTKRIVNKQVRNTTYPTYRLHASEFTTKAEVEFAAVITDAVIQADRPDGCRDTEAETGGNMDAVIVLIPGDISRAIPGRAGIDEEDALDFLGNRIAVFYGSRIHLVAAEFVIFITTQVIGAA